LKKKKSGTEKRSAWGEERRRPSGVSYWGGIRWLSKPAAHWEKILQWEADGKLTDSDSTGRSVKESIPEENLSMRVLGGEKKSRGDRVWPGPFQVEPDVPDRQSLGGKEKGFDWHARGNGEKDQETRVGPTPLGVSDEIFFWKT